MEKGKRLLFSLCSIALEHFAVAVDGEGSTAGGKGDAAVVAAGLLAGFLGSAECFFKAGAVISSHVAKAKWPGCQKLAICERGQ